MIGASKISPKPFDVVLLWKFSRFARSREDSIVYKSMLRKERGIDVISVSEKLGDDKLSVLIEALIEAMDEYYSINLGEEVKRGMREKVDRGGAVSIPAFGYKIIESKYVADIKKAHIVRALFRDYLDGAGLRELAVKLNEKGIRTTRGGLWENRTVEYVLRNPVYTGKIRWNPERKTKRNFNDKDIIITQGSHKPIVSEDVFNKTQKRLDENKQAFRKGEHHIPRNSDFMLRGLVKCSECGSTLVQSAKGASLQCHKYAHGKCSVSHSITTKIISEAVLNQINQDLTLGSFNIIPGIARNTDNENTERQIERLTKKLNRAKDAYEDGVYSLNEFKERKNKVEGEIKILNSKRETKKDSAEEAFERKASVKAGAELLTDPKVSETEKNIALRQIVSKIVFNRKGNEISLFYR
jgi:DNA invertase Pin-like site-specific DNA recombinase/exonuclease VII small subunit